MTNVNFPSPLRVKFHKPLHGYNFHHQYIKFHTNLLYSVKETRLLFVETPLNDMHRSFLAVFVVCNFCVSPMQVRITVLMPPRVSEVQR